MKALSIKQPFAELILQGRKTIELRTWTTAFRGAFLIHASRAPDRKAMERFGFSALPCGAILGKARLVAVKKYVSEQDHRADHSRHLATSAWGTYGFVLEDVQRIEPLDARGRLGFWEAGPSPKITRLSAFAEGKLGHGGPAAVQRVSGRPPGEEEILSRASRGVPERKPSGKVSQLS
ncbi:MAG: ASCH domain-containing protein [Candidatus Aenigmarchaeota archaeon]|nr:ASCH domain-containing protein [Candidatus Aenigmarchaeota archaeon]